jgi:hypothetical protein
MSLEPRRTKSNRIPTELFVRISRTNPRAYEVVTADGEILAAEVPDINSARIFAAAPLLLDGLYDARWELLSWAFSNLEEEVCDEDDEDDESARYKKIDIEPSGKEHMVRLLRRLAEAEAAASTPEGLYPIG